VIRNLSLGMDSKDIRYEESISQLCSRILLAAIPKLD
jgi:hypothetical protein